MLIWLFLDKKLEKRGIKLKMLTFRESVNRTVYPIVMSGWRTTLNVTKISA